MKYGAGLGTKLMKGWTLGNRQFPTVTGNKGGVILVSHTHLHKKGIVW